MDKITDRILYLAVADGRGHLMRAHLVRRLMAERGVTVDIVTTSPDGAAFLAGLGTPSAAVLSGGFCVAFDDRHQMQRRRTELRLARYLVARGGLWRDIAALRRMAGGCALLVNDSLHPAGLAVSGELRVVDVCGANLWHAAAHNFDDRLPSWTSAAYRRLISGAAARAFGRITHSASIRGEETNQLSPRHFRLPALTASPRRPRQVVRHALGIRQCERLAALYFNPHFRDPAIAVAVETALRADGYHFYGISEPWAGRPGWRAQDPDFSEVVNASDLLVSGAGAAALQQARVYRLPLLAILGEQPEQERNIAQWSDGGAGGGAGTRVVKVSTLADLRPAIAALTRPPAPAGNALTEDVIADEVSRIRTIWGDAFAALMKEPSDDQCIVHQRPDSGDQQPARWRRQLRRRRAQPDAPAVASANADKTAVGA